MYLSKFISLPSTLLIVMLGLNTTALAEEAKPDNLLYEKALNAYKKDKITESVIYLKNALKEDRNNLPARLLFGKILLDEGELAAAEEQYRRAIALNADTALVVLPLARSLLLQNKYKELLESVKDEGFSSGISADISSMRGNAYIGLKEYALAKASFNTALEHSPMHINAILGLSSVATYQSDNILAEKLIAQAKLVSNNSPLVWFFEGEMNRKKGNKEQALIAYNNALEIAPDYNDALRARISIYLDQDELPLAKQDIDSILQDLPDDPLTKLLKIIYLAKTGELPQAKSLLSETNFEFSQMDPEFVDQYAPVLLIYGVSLYMEGQYQSSSEYLQKYLDQKPTSINAREILAEIANKRGEKDRVVQLLKPIEKMFLSVRAASLLFSALLQSEDNLGAIELYKSLSLELANLNSIKGFYAVALIKSRNEKNQIEAMNLLESLSIGSTNASAQLMLGYNYMNMGMYNDALVLAKKIYDPIKNTVVELNFIGTVYLAMNDDINAEKHFNEALVKSPDDEIVKINLLQLHIKQGQYKKSEKTILEMLSKSPNNKNILPLYAEVLEKLSRYEEAVTTYELLASLDNLNVTTKYKLAELHLKLRNPDKALEAAKDINELESLSPVGLIVKAKAYLQKSDYINASKTLKILFGMYLTDADRLFEIATLQIEAKDWLAFDNTMNYLKKLSVDKAKLGLLTAQRLYAEGNVELALSTLEAFNNKLPKMNSLMANLYLAKKDYALAIESAKISLQHDNSYTNHVLLVKAYWLNKQFSQAFMQFENWLGHHNDHWQGKRMFANLLEQRDESQKAIYWYRETLKLAPNDVFSLNNLALILLGNNNSSEGLELIEQASLLAPLDAKVNDTYGWILVNLQEYEEGLKYLRESYARDVNNAKTMYHIGFTLDKLAKYQESQYMLKQALNKTQDKELLSLIQLLLDKS